MRKYKLAIIGSGSLGSIIAKVVAQDLYENYEIVGILSRKFKNAKRLGEEVNCKAYKTLQELIDDKPDYVIEAASPAVFKDIGYRILANSISLIPLSIGALADREFYNKIAEAAIENNSRVHLPAGAVGGFDVLRAAKLMETVEVDITTEKSPTSLNGAPFLKGRKLSENKPEEIFSGFAKEAITHFPKNINVAVATALATTGVDQTKVAINSIPKLKSNRHKIKLTGETVNVEVSIETTPSENNPKSSTLAAYSVINTLINLVSPITF